MAKLDVAVIGAGAAGLTAAALLAKEGKKVAVYEASQWLGGRGMAVPDEGFQLNLGAHLLEDTGSGITKVFDYVGKKLEHGKANTDMLVWDHETNRWGSIRDRYAGQKTELRKVIGALLETPYEELDRWDDRPMRTWMLQHTSDQGVIDLFEYITVLEAMTEEWYDHSASDNLYVRKMHYGETKRAAYSFWPGQGWAGMFEDLRDAVVEHGGEVHMRTPVDTVMIEDGEVKGLMLGRDKILPNEVLEGEVVEADCVISTLPVWHVLRVVSPSVLPDWYTAQIRFLAEDRWRVAWCGIYFATKEPIYTVDPAEISTFMHAPVSNQSGFFLPLSMLDPTVSPPGTYLYVAGGMMHGGALRDMSVVKRTMEQFEEGLKIMHPALEHAYWRRRHLVLDPTFGVIQKPGLVGAFRPHWRAPNVDGLYFASESFRSRGIGVDRAARAALTVVEDYLGRRLDGGFGWRY